MRKTIIFICVLGLYSAKAQDTIPFWNNFFSYPNFDTNFTFPHLPIENLPVHCCYNYSHNHPITADHRRWYSEHEVSPGTALYGIATTANQPTLPPDVSLAAIARNELGYYTIDSIRGDSLYYCKNVFYQYKWGPYYNMSENCDEDSLVVPCYLYFFENGPAFVPGIFYVGFIGGKTTSCSDYNYVIKSSIRCIQRIHGVMTAQGTVDLNMPGSHESPDCFYGGIFPILQLPCVTPRKPQTETHRAGHARISWHPGDTALYQLVFRSPNGTVVLETDTLADTSFVLTDSLIADTSLLREGWCSVSLRKACNYMDSPYHTIVWSDWSEPKRFYYTPYRDINGISTPVVEPPYFTLAPNPAEGDVTVTFGEPLPEGCTLDLFGPDGRLLSSLSIPATATTFQLATNQYPTGLYLLRLSTPVSSSSRKLSIVR